MYTHEIGRCETDMIFNILFMIQARTTDIHTLDVQQHQHIIKHYSPKIIIC